MSVNVERELVRLEMMSVSELRGRYAELFGEPTRGRHRQSLIRRILWRLQAVQEGDLSKRAQKRAVELANDADLRLQPPRQVSVAGNVQRPNSEPRPEGVRSVRFSDAKEKRLLCVGTGRGKTVLPAVGTVLTRPYKGRLIEVTVLETGFAYQGEQFATLSGLAKRITGSHWNGWHFFGLTKQERTRS
jgi:hypothetical protein